jgi:hypothetical protein
MGDYSLAGETGMYVRQVVAGSIIGSRSGAFGFNSVAGTSQTAAYGQMYVLTNTSLTTVALPANADTQAGDTFKIIGLSGGYLISQAADQQIIIGTESTTLGASGFVQCSGSLFNSITLTCVSTAGGVFIWAAIDPPQGSFAIS